MTTATVNGAPTQLSQIASFNISSGEPNWTYQVTPGSQLSLIAAADGNGRGEKQQIRAETTLLSVLIPAEIRASIRGYPAQFQRSISLSQTIRGLAQPRQVRRASTLLRPSN